MEGEDQKIRDMDTENIPRMAIITQSCVQSEIFSKNGVQKEVHVVVKNLSFQMEVEAYGLDMTRANLSTKLLYDYDRDGDPKVEVSYVKNEPLECKVNITDHGAKALVDVKIKVLTSQHEDMLFRVQMTATVGEQYQVEAVSKPIKVISKITQNSSKRSTPTMASPGTTPIAKKRSSSGISTIPSSPVQADTATMLARIEQQQQLHTTLLQAISRKLFGTDDPLLLLAEQTIANGVAPQIITGTEVTHAIPVDESDVDALFRKFVTSVNRLQPDAQQEKISALMQTLAPNDSERFAELLGSFSDTAKKRLKTKAEKTH